MQSGRYSGESGENRLDLRIDVDPASGAGRLSGDLFRAAAGGPQSHRASFVTEAVVLAASGSVDAPISTPASPHYAGGAVRLTRLATTDGLRVKLSLVPAAGGAAEAIDLEVVRRGAALRALRIAPLVVAGAQPPDSPILAAVPAPAGEEDDGGPAAGGGDEGDAGGRVSFVGALAAAGFEIELAAAEPLDAVSTGDADADDADGADSDDELWTDAEIHATLAERAAGAPPAVSGEPWSLPLLIASRGDRPQVVGITFDTGDPAVGRVSAVFYQAVLGHPKVRGEPAAFAREYLFTCVHEVGHLLGLPHAWEPFGGVGEPERGRRALSFMNYPHLYIRGYRRFYEDFRFRFRDEEVLHLRHAAWPRIHRGAAAAGVPAVPAGAGPQHLLAPPSRSPLSLELSPPAGEGAARFRFAQPVLLEVRLANRSRRRVRVPADVVDPEGGRLRLFVERLDAAAGEGAPVPAWRPAVERDRSAPPRVLGVAGRRGEPTYALYGVVDLTFGRDGFPFAEPGRYRVTATTVLADGERLRSAPLEVEIVPPEREEEAAAGDLLTHEVGCALAFGGDPRGTALERLREVVARRRPAGLVPWAAMRLGEARSRSFKRPWRDSTTAADPAAAADWLERATAEARRLRAAFPNPVRSRLLRMAADCHARAGRAEAAQRVLGDLHDFVDSKVRRNRRLRRQLLADVERLGGRLRRRLAGERGDT